DVKFSLKECPANESLWRQIIVIDDALASEASEVIVEVELQCGCDCGTAINSKCINGINECGICKCDFGWSGETCNCNENSWTGNKQQCIYPGETEICSGRGECICGECSCDPGYSGLFCECSPCDKIDDVECSGRGSCDCGRCSCSTGWKGEGCQCPSDDNLCIPPGDNEVCAGHGYCDCGQCRCNETAPDGLLYRGTYCEATAGAGGSGFCSFFVSCVNATIEESTKARDSCHTNFSIFRTQRVSTLNSESDRYCFIRKVKDTTICTIPYVYEFNKDNTVTLNIGDKTCYTPMPAAFFPGIIFGAVVLFGIIALLIWKGWTIMKDKREYTKFEKERQQTIYSLNENPLYRPAISHFRVPSMIKED
ncbi:integrin beta-PS, partial [Cephus cinctus]|uniref:Integrin beta-PS n=1 Tax=Cephus cinctus TaxID=211228 RepID=A0AAJ7BH06_CEPCN